MKKRREISFAFLRRRHARSHNRNSNPALGPIFQSMHLAVTAFWSSRKRGFPRLPEAFRKRARAGEHNVNRPRDPYPPSNDASTGYAPVLLRQHSDIKQQSRLRRQAHEELSETLVVLKGPPTAYTARWRARWKGLCSPSKGHSPRPRWGRRRSWWHGVRDIRLLPCQNARWPQYLLYGLTLDHTTGDPVERVWPRPRLGSSPTQELFGGGFQRAEDLGVPGLHGWEVPLGESSQASSRAQVGPGCTTDSCNCIISLCALRINCCPSVVLDFGYSKSSSTIEPLILLLAEVDQFLVQQEMEQFEIVQTFLDIAVFPGPILSQMLMQSSNCLMLLLRNVFRVMRLTTLFCA